MDREPFQPFRVRLKDGRTFDIVHPNMGMVTEAVFTIGIPAPDDPNPIYADRSEWIRFSQIDALELLPSPSSTAS